MSETQGCKPLAAVPSVPGDDVSSLNRIVVELLEELLEEARAGAIRGCAVAIVHAEGATSDRWASGAGMVTASMVGAIEIMSHRYTGHAVERSNP